MPSSSARAGLVIALVLACSGLARAQQVAQGFAVERLYQSAPGAGWVVMDALDMHGGLGGAIEFSTGYSHDAWRVPSTLISHGLSVVSDQAFAEVGAAITYQRFRLSVNIDSPLLVRGQSGAIEQICGIICSTGYTAPNVTLGTSPDVISDVRFGFEARIVGDARDPFRLGLSAQLYVPSGNRADFVTDGTVRAMGRVLVAGDIGSWAYAGQVGVHLRPLSENPPGSPQGSELLFGGAVGPRIAVGRNGTTDLILGPEVFGETALTSPGGKTTTGVEALLSARTEGTGEDAPQTRFKLGIGAGLDPNFGVPQWRAVFSAEGFEFNVRSPH